MEFYFTNPSVETLGYFHLFCEPMCCQPLPLPRAGSLLILSVLKSILVLCVFAITSAPSIPASAESLNGLVLEQVKAMPAGGKYSVSRYAKIKLQSAAHFESGKLFAIPKAPYPSFCSGATYLFF